jgi:hypothetical protein
LANRTAMAWPMPVDAPVISTFFPSNRNIISSLSMLEIQVRRHNIPE